jgi:hypothetical protein
MDRRVNAKGWVSLRFFVFNFKAVNHDQSWYPSILKD